MIEERILLNGSTLLMVRLHTGHLPHPVTRHIPATRVNGVLMFPYDLPVAVCKARSVTDKLTVEFKNMEESNK